MSAHAEPVAIVTGGSGDIGRAVAAALTRTMQVVVTARRAAPLGTVAGARIHAHPSDALDQRSVDTLADWTLERFGRIDVLVNCAASTASVAGSIEDVDVDGLVGDLDTKVGGYLRYVRAVVPAMKRQGGGRIVNIGGLTGRSSDTLSGMRNVAVSHLTKVLSDQLGAHGIAVNAVHPGIVATPHLDAVFARHAQAQGTTPAAIAATYVAEIPMRRILSVEEIADAVAMLAAPGMTAITGQSITVDGGYSRGIYL